MIKLLICVLADSRQWLSVVGSKLPLSSKKKIFSILLTARALSLCGAASSSMRVFDLLSCRPRPVTIGALNQLDLSGFAPFLLEQRWPVSKTSMDPIEVRSRLFSLLRLLLGAFSCFIFLFLKSLSSERHD